MTARQFLFVNSLRLLTKISQHVHIAYKIFVYHILVEQT